MELPRRALVQPALMNRVANRVRVPKMFRLAPEMKTSLEDHLQRYQADRNGEARLTVVDEAVAHIRASFVVNDPAEVRDMQDVSFSSIFLE